MSNSPSYRDNQLLKQFEAQSRAVVSGAYDSRGGDEFTSFVRSLRARLTRGGKRSGRGGESSRSVASFAVTR